MRRSLKALHNWMMRTQRGRELVRRPAARRLAFEPLEGRRLLAVSGTEPAILGTVFQDLDGSNTSSAGEVLPAATIQLFRDDGDGSFEFGGDDVQVGADAVTDSNGRYCFDNLDADLGYFVRQPAQTVSGVALNLRVSSLIRPGDPGLIIDGFQTMQEAEAMPPAPSTAGSVLVLANETEVIGRERDLLVELTSGGSPARLQVNPFGVQVLQVATDPGAVANFVVTWDGVDGDFGRTPAMGLGGRDLTQGGANTGISLRLGIDPSGAGEEMTLRLYQGSAANFSSVSVPIPVTDGTAADFLLIPFSSFTGDVNPSNVDAIQLFFGSGTASIDGQVDVVGAIGPKVQNFANVPEADLAITKTDGQTTAVPGQSLTYTIVVTNNGPSNVNGATIADSFPAGLTNVTYTSTATGGATGNTASGAGNISHVVNMPSGSTITYTVTGTVSAAATGMISNTASVVVPTGVVDTNPLNNSATDEDTLTPRVDLSITKTNNVTTVTAGGQVTYTIVVQNAGPSNAVGALVTDAFPAALTNITFTSVATGGATGNNLSGTGNISNTVNLPVGSRITYTVQATVSPTATGTLVNTASVAAATGTTDVNTANNSATDSDPIQVPPASVAGFVYVDVNNSGARDNQDAPLSGVTLRLTATGVDRTTTTDATGAYRFEDLTPGTYTLVQTPPPWGFEDGNETVGDSGLGNIPTGTNDQFQLVLGAGDEAEDFNFAELAPSKRRLLASAFE